MTRKPKHYRFDCAVKKDPRNNARYCNIQVSGKDFVVLNHLTKGEINRKVNQLIREYIDSEVDESTQQLIVHYQAA